MDVSFQPDSDLLIHKTDQYQVYCKRLQHRLYVVEPADSPPQATILLIHGICEHSLRHFPFAIDLARNGFQTLLFDLKAHGLSSEQIEPYLWLIRAYAEMEDPAEIVALIASEAAVPQEVRGSNTDRMKGIEMEDHLNQIASVIHALVPEKTDASPSRFFMAGQSMGGLLAAEAAWRLGKYGPIRPDGVMLFSPALKPIASPEAGRLEKGLVFLSWASHHHAVLTPLRWVIQGFFNFALLRWLFANIEKGTRWVTCWISDIPEERELYHVDPLIVRAAPLGYLASIERQMVSTLRKGTGYPVDTILFVPLADRIVNSEGSVAFGERICATRGTGSSLVTYSDFWCHELLRSSKKSEVLDALYEWIEAR